MNRTSRIIVVALLVCAASTVLVMKYSRQEADSRPETAPGRPSVAAANKATPPAQEEPESTALPRLVDLGAGKCIQCKMMAPILEELKKEYAGTFEVEFIDVWKNPKAGEQYGIRMIPTQIFYDAAGKELFRHEGFFGKEQILARWKEYGVAASAEQGE